MTFLNNSRRYAKDFLITAIISSVCSLFRNSSYYPVIVTNVSTILLTLDFLISITTIE